MIIYKEMEVTITYRVYEVNHLNGYSSNSEVRMNIVSFPSGNNFDSVDEAVQALIDAGRSWENFTILPHVYITNY